MGHGIDRNDVFGEVARAQRAWHGLGKVIPEGLSAEQGFVDLGLGWSTTLAPLQALMPSGIINIPDRRAHIRCDTNDCLGIVSEDYKSFENIELARFADSLAGADKAVIVETCGSLYNGRRIFALVRLPHDIHLGKTGEDALQQYVLVSNGHGGFAATACYPTSIRVVCANTLRWSEQDFSRGIRFRHIGDVETKVAQARLVLGTAIEESKKFEAKVKTLADIVLTQAQLDAYLDKAWDAIFGKIDLKADADFVAKLVAKKKEMVEQWRANLAHPQQTIDGIEGTAWAAYNAISMYEDHQHGRFRPVTKSDARIAANVFGTTHVAKSKAFRLAFQAKSLVG